MLILLQPGRVLLLLCAAAADSLLLRAGSAVLVPNAAGLKWVPQLRLLVCRPMGAVVVTPCT